MRLDGLTVCFTGTAAMVADYRRLTGTPRAAISSNGVDMSVANGWGCDGLHDEPALHERSALEAGVWHGAPGLVPRLVALEVSADLRGRHSERAWIEHTHHVSNVCDDLPTPGAVQPNVYGSILTFETRNWTLPWLISQNV